MLDRPRDRRARNSRNEILDAAEQVVAAKGANHLTIDAVAEVSGFSKGGVLYNFPTKMALIEGLLDRKIEEHEAQVLAERERLSGPNRTLRAALNSQFRAAADKRPLMSAFFAAMAENPGFIEGIQPEVEARVKEIVEEADDEELALILWLAGQGLVLSSALRFYEFDDDTRRRIEDRLKKIAAGEEMIP